MRVWVVVYNPTNEKELKIVNMFTTWKNGILWNMLRMCRTHLMQSHLRELDKRVTCQAARAPGNDHTWSFTQNDDDDDMAGNENSWRIIKDKDNCV